MKKEPQNLKNQAILGSLIESKKGHVDMRSFSLLPIVIGIHAIVLAAMVISSVWSIPYITEVKKMGGPIAYHVDFPLLGDSGTHHGKSADMIKPPVSSNIPPINIPIYKPEINMPDENKDTGIGFRTGVEGGFPEGTWVQNPDDLDDFIPKEGVPQPPQEIIQDPRTKANGVPPQIIYKILPEYPELARNAHIEGMVILEAVVNKDGTVRSVSIQRADSPLFQQPAINAAMQFRFAPGTIDGKPVASYCTIVIIFQLK